MTPEDPPSEPDPPTVEGWVFWLLVALLVLALLAMCCGAGLSDPS